GELSFGGNIVTAASANGSTLTYSAKASASGSTDTITIPVTGAKNYNNYEVTVTITAKDRDDAGVSITGDNEITYGNAGFVLTARVTTPGTGTGTWEWDSSDKTVATVDNNGNVTILAAGTTTITAKYESDTTAGQDTITLTVNRKTITEEDFTLPIEAKTYNASEQTQAVASSTLTKDVDYEIKYENNINAGTASYTITGKGNYDGTINKTFTIQKAVPTVSDVTVTAPTTVYNSNTITDITLGFTDNPSGGSIQLDDGQTLEVGTKDYNWTYTPKDSDIANYSTVTGKVSITVQAAPVKPTITTNSLPNGRVGSAYNFTLEAPGTWSITWSYTGTMPDGLNMDNDGKITGTPTTEETKTITVKAENSEGEDTKDFTITILPKSSGGGGGGGGGVEAPITKYTLTYETNGGSAVAATKHDDGTTVNLTATPTKEGYSFDGWYADAALTSKITSVKMDGDKTVYAGWKEADKPTRPSNPFTDVAKGMYYYDAILWAINHDLQITSGTGATIFSPNATCTRGQIMTFLWRAAGRPEPMGNNNPFADVEADAYYYKAVMWALEKGFTKGTSATTFSPNAGCTRGQVMTFLYRYENAPILGGMANPFNDVARGAYYYDAVLWAVNHDPQITNGTNATTFSPDAICTRGQIVTFLYRDMNGK
ncbi:MAG: S-layer homology domain-containing protein, partial [Anaerotignum sp.]|nr:S-layer homology domain-containing protein [Anaerotignum sp.]